MVNRSCTADDDGDVPYKAQVHICDTKSNISSTLFRLIHEAFLRSKRRSSNNANINKTNKNDNDLDDDWMFTIALSGGSLPPLLKTLPIWFENNGIDPQWNRWNILLADERIVPSTSQDSNLKAIKLNLPFLFNKAKMVFGIDESLLILEKTEEVTTVHDVAEEYEKRAIRPLLRKSIASNSLFLDKVVVVDLALLGFGPDGHTCSLFSNHALLQDYYDDDNNNNSAGGENGGGKMIAALDDSPKHPPCRITFTLRLLNDHTSDVVFVGAGCSKCSIIESIMRRRLVDDDHIDGKNKGEDGTVVDVVMVDPPPYPCGMVRPFRGRRRGVDDVFEKRGRLIWVVDKDAAPKSLRKMS